MSSLNKKVLVTGVTGFFGSHIIIELLNNGYKVVGTSRDISKAETIENIVHRNTNNVNSLKLKVEDLNNNSDLEMVTICPVVILAPVLEEDFGTPTNIGLKILEGSSPAITNIGFEIVDVCSVTQLLVKSLEIPEASGQRINASAGFLSFMQVADILRKTYPGKKIPKRMLPNFAIRLFSYFEKTLKPILIDLGTERKLDN
ncbi:MAG: GDP-mannose 4,6-dehydratase, partial [Bacteroidales bacterium]|nr:GDP-mannose 4,6-dehydratase [Bacteroidales bacterium]